MRRYELSDDQWAAIAPLLPTATTGRPRRDDRTTLNGVFWKLCSGATWRDVPERYGPWRTVNDRFCRYRDDGTLDGALDRILTALRLRPANKTSGRPPQVSSAHPSRTSASWMSSRRS